MEETVFMGGKEVTPFSEMDSGQQPLRMALRTFDEKDAEMRSPAYTLAHCYPYPTYTQMRTICVYSFIYVVLFPL